MPYDTRYQAVDRLHALADVFEHVGDYSAADCCREWAVRLAPEGVGDLMAAAILQGAPPRTIRPDELWPTEGGEMIHVTICPRCRRRWPS